MQYKNQVNKLDCGIYTLQFLYEYFYKKQIETSILKNQVDYSNDGISLENLSILAKKIGIKTEIYKGNFESFKKINFNQPFITIIKNENYLHYVLIQKLTTKNNLIYYDPLIGKQKINIDEFGKKYFGIIILCTKDQRSFSLSKNEIINFFKIKKSREMIWISISYIVISILGFVSSFYIKIILDQIMPTNSSSKLLIITMMFIIIFFIKIGLTKINGFVINIIETNSQIELIEKYIKKLKKVSWLKIAHYDESTHLKNLDIILKLTSFRTKHFINIANDIFSLLCSTIFLISLDIKIFFIGFVCSLFIVGTSLFFKNKFKPLESQILEKSTKFKKRYLNIINCVEQFKLNQRSNFLENTFKEELNGLVDIQKKVINISSLYSFLITTINNITPFLIVILTINQIWKNNLTTGELFLFLSFMNFFINPIGNIMSFIVELPKIKEYEQNIDSFFNLEEEATELKNKIDRIENIKLESINFKYDSNKQIIKIDNLEIKDKLRIQGKNGSGKSTLLKIIATLITKQNVYYNNKKWDFYELESLRKEICYISNNEYIPSGSIYNFLVSKNEENKRIFLDNLNKFKILELFEKMELNLHTIIDNGGKNISSGQKQFILLMKLFSNNYSLILLDEAFENIDENIIKEIFDLLRSYLENKIVIEVSHRDNYLFNKEVFNCD